MNYGDLWYLQPYNTILENQHINTEIEKPDFFLKVKQFAEMCKIRQTGPFSAS